MPVRKSIAFALVTVAFATPAFAGEPTFTNGNAGLQVAQAVDEFGNPLPPRKRRQAAPEEGTPETGSEAPAAEPGQKKVRKAAPNDQAPDAAAEGQEPAAEEQSPRKQRKAGQGGEAPVVIEEQQAPAEGSPPRKQRKAGQGGEAPVIIEEEQQAPEGSQTRRQRKAGQGGQAPVAIEEEQFPPEDPLPRRLRKNGRKGPDVIIEVQTPSSDQILRKLEAPVRVAPRRSERVTIREFKRRPELRRAAPSIDIQSINFAFGSAEIPYSQYGKVETIANALDRLLSRRPDTRILIEGHTDAVGSYASNQSLSEARAASLRRMLAREFGIPPYAMETVGYGEEYLLVPTQAEEWQNRRVTLRRIDDFVR